jgi:hypothetical protein
LPIQLNWEGLAPGIKIARMWHYDTLCRRQ